MSNVNLADALVPRSVLDTLLSRLPTVGNSSPLRQLVTDTIALRGSERAQVEATIRLLSALDLVTETPEADGGRLLTGRVTRDNLTIDLVAERLLIYLKTMEILPEFVSGLQVEEIKGDLLIDQLAIPWRWNHVRHFLREIGVLQRADVDERYWTVTSEFCLSFLEQATQLCMRDERPDTMTLEQLKRLQELDARLGAEAEEWVLARERRRLSHHKLKNSIRRISDQSVASGFDIKSFSSNRTLKHDRFLEVKSFADYARFYWSSNEVETAKALSEQYFLVLVDRKKMSDPNYEPIEIRDPYDSLFLRNNPAWARAESTWIFERIEGQTQTA